MFCSYYNYESTQLSGKQNEKNERKKKICLTSLSSLILLCLSLIPSISLFSVLYWLKTENLKCKYTNLAWNFCKSYRFSCIVLNSVETPLCLGESSLALNAEHLVTLPLIGVQNISVHYTKQPRWSVLLYSKLNKFIYMYCN